MQYSRAVGLLIALASCGTTPKQAATRAQDVDSLKADLARVEQDLEAIRSKLNHLESELAAVNPEHEFNALTVERLTWSNFQNEPRASRTVLAHVREWRDFAALKRFTQLADRTFFFEAEGRAPIEADAGVGGVSNPDGSVRCAVIHPSGELEPGVIYRLKARNQNERYRWVVGDGVMIAGK